MPYLDVNGIRLYYEEHGDGAPIVCIHATDGLRDTPELRPQTRAPTEVRSRAAEGQQTLEIKAKQSRAN